MNNTRIGRLIGAVGLSVCASLTLAAAGPAPQLKIEPVALLQAAAGNDAHAVLGDWHGTSLCLVKPSACQDEEALYHVKTDKSGKLQIDADKVVDGKPENMGTIDCTYDAAAKHIHCEWGHGILDLTLQGDHLDGTMFRPDKTKWRDIKLTRVKP
jgi:hypothetical protein